MGRTTAKKLKAERSTEPAVGLFDRALRLMALAGVYGALLAMVLMLSSTAYPYVFSKTLILQATIAVSLPAFLLLLWRQPALRPRRSWLSIALGAYFLALVLSCVFAFNRHRSFWGSQERMAGLFSMAHFFVWYVMATSLLRTWQGWRRLFHWQAALGLLAALVALVDLGDPQGVRLYRVLGNPIYCATYQLFTVGILALLWVRTQSSILRVLYAACAVVSLTTIFFTGSRGPLLGLAASLALVAFLWAITGRSWRYWAAAVAAVLLAGAAYTSVVLLKPSWSLRYGLQHLFVHSSDQMRPRLWSMALSGFRDHPLLGWGPGNFDAVVDAHYLPHTYCTEPQDNALDTAHSVTFEHLSGTGALGTLAFAAVWIAFALSLRRAHRQGWIEVRAYYALVGLAAAYLIQGQFVTDSPSSHAMMFLLLAAGCAAGFPEFGVSKPPLAQPLAFRSTGLTPWALLVLQAGGVFLAWRGSVLPGLASKANLESKISLGEGGCAAMLANARLAAAEPSPWSEDQLRTLSTILAKLAEADTFPRCPEWRDLYQIAKQKAEDDYGGRPEHSRTRAGMAKFTLLLALKTRDPELLKASEQYYESLIADSPRRQLYRYEFAKLLAQTDRVSAGDEHLAQALAVDPELGESLWRLGAYRWHYENDHKTGSRMVIKAVYGSCPHFLDKASDARLLAQAFVIQDDIGGLRSMERRLESLPPNDPKVVTSYVDIARLLEQKRMLPERDRLLRIAAARDVAINARLAPLLDGRVKTIAEAEQLSALAARKP